MTTLNPRVAAYISPRLHQRLEEWREERKIKTISTAIATILEEFLIADPPPQTDPSLGDRLSHVESELAELKTIVEQLSKVEPLKTEPPSMSEFFKTAYDKHYGAKK